MDLKARLFQLSILSETGLSESLGGEGARAAAERGGYSLRKSAVISFVGSLLRVVG